MQESLMSQGFELLLAGMGMVFTFLTLLVVCTRLMSSLVGRYFPEPEESEVLNVGAPPIGTDISMVDKNTLAAIRAAIQEHRARR